MASRLRSPGVSAVLLLIVTAALYWPTMGYGYVWEDENDLGRLERSVFAPDNPVNPARVLTELSLDASHALSPNSAAAGHAMNVAWHLVNVALVLALAWLWLPPWGAVLAAGVFALHPLQVETVAYVASRSELVATTGLLLALLAASLGSLTGALVGVVLACLGKESAFMAWGLVPLWALGTRTTFPVRKFLLIGVGLGLMGGAVFLSRVTHLSLTLDAGLIGRTSAAVLRLTSLVFVPLGQSIDHDWRGVSLTLQAVALGLMVSLTMMALLELQRRRSWFAIAWLATVLLMLPRFVVANTEGLHEHHMALSMVFWSLALGAWLSHSHSQELT